MAVDTRTHHILPTAAHDLVKTGIARWATFDDSQNAGDDLIQRPGDASGATVRA